MPINLTHHIRFPPRQNDTAVPFLIAIALVHVDVMHNTTYQTISNSRFICNHSSFVKADFLCRINLKSVLYNEAVCQVNTLMTLLNGALLSAVNSNTILTAGHYEKYGFTTTCLCLFVYNAIRFCRKPVLQCLQPICIVVGGAYGLRCPLPYASCMA